LESSADSKENRLPAYVILTRERTRNESRLNEYRPIVPASFQKHPAKFRAIHGRHQVWKVPQSKKSSSSNFPPSTTPAPGSTAPDIKPPAYTACRAAITAALPT
jgi:hypothetical protein